VAQSVNRSLYDLRLNPPPFCMVDIACLGLKYVLNPYAIFRPLRNKVFAEFNGSMNEVYVMESNCWQQGQ